MTTIRAAVYARKSTEEDDIAAEAKSVNRQIEGGREFIASRGWTLDESHIYSDDAVSGALFTRRPDFQRMMRDAEAGAFEAVVLYDLDRFGRHGHKTMVALNTLADLGVAIWDYTTGQAVDLDSFEGRLSATLKAEFAQQYREQVRKHTRTAMRTKAEQGFVTGGKVFGYNNVHLAKGQTTRELNQPEAAVIRDIYTRFAAGEGLRTIAAALNRSRAPSPRAQQGRPNGWSSSTVREVLMRPLYRGEVVYGRTRSAYGRELGKRLSQRDGKRREKAQLPTAEKTWIRHVNEDFRIVDAGLAASVDAKRLKRRGQYFASLARRGAQAPEKAHGKYLLSGGMLICPTCGGHFEGVRTVFKNGALEPRKVYVCATRRRKPGVCPNTPALPMEETDDLVLSMVEGEILGTRFIEELLALVDSGETDDTAWLTADRDRLRAEVNRLVGSIASGVPPESVAPLIRTHEMEIARLEARLRAPRAPRPDIEKLRGALTLRAAQWKATLRNEPPVARLLLRRLVEPLVLHDESERPEWLRWEAQAKNGLLDGLYNCMASPPGFEPGFQP